MVSNTVGEARWRRVAAVVVVVGGGAWRNVSRVVLGLWCRGGGPVSSGASLDAWSYVC